MTANQEYRAYADAADLPFKSYVDYTNHLQDEMVAALEAKGHEIDTGYSNVSCSRYVTVKAEILDEDGDEATVDVLKIRFSDHADRHGSDLSFEAQHTALEILDEDDDEFLGLEFQEWQAEEFIKNALVAADAAVKKATQNA